MILLLHDICEEREEELPLVGAETLDLRFAHEPPFHPQGKNLTRSELDNLFVCRNQKNRHMQKATPLARVCV